MDSKNVIMGVIATEIIISGVLLAIFTPGEFESIKPLGGTVLTIIVFYYFGAKVGETAANGALAQHIAAEHIAEKIATTVPPPSPGKVG